jgi:hypothetical protein
MSADAGHNRGGAVVILGESMLKREQIYIPNLGPDILNQFDALDGALRGTVRRVANGTNAPEVDDGEDSQ